MSPSLSRGQEIVLPPSALRALADAAAAAMPGGEGVLLEAGREVGRLLHPLVMKEEGGDAQGSFWERLQMHLARRGLGSIRHRRIHPGIGLLESRGVAELAGEVAPGEARPFAPFTTGLLRGLLSAAAGRTVELRQLDGVIGGAPCRWVFGSSAALDALERGMERGRTLEEAVAEL